MMYDGIHYDSQISGKVSSTTRSSSSLRSRVLELERELLNMELGKGECARINAYMQKHFNDILSFLSRFLTVRERPKLLYTILLLHARE